MIILIGAQKGGVGKSTIAINLCSALANNGKSVMLVDSDKQSSASNWCDDRSENPELSKVNCSQKYDNIRATLLEFNEKYDYVICDIAGSDNSELRTGLVAADLLLMPIKGSQFDLDTVPKMLDIVETTRESVNPGLEFKAVISMAPTNPIIGETKEAEEFLSDYEGIELLNTIIRERIVFRKSVKGIGKGVIEMDDAKAKKEINDLIKEII